MTTEKKCPKCGETKPVSEWGRNKAHKDGLQSWCRVCRGFKQQADRSTPDGRAKSNAASVKCHQKARATEEGRAKHTAANVKCLTERRKTDAWYRLRNRLSSETNRVLKDLAKGRGTNAACIKLFGATREDVLAHFEEQLTARGWDWSDYQILWQCDHRVPMGLAQTDDELRTLALLPNLQVLSPEENAIKAIADAALVKQAEGEAE